MHAVQSGGLLDRLNGSGYIAEVTNPRVTMKTIAALLLGLLAWGAQAMEVGDPVPSWTLPDQFDESYTLEPTVQVLLVARSMDAAKLVNEAIEKQPQGYLEARNAVFVADIERMPGIAKMFAVPAMRSANYRIVLDRDGKVASQYANYDETVTWLQLKEGRLQARQSFKDAATLRAALELLPKP